MNDKKSNIQEKIKSKKKQARINNELLLNYRNFGDMSDDNCINDLYKKRKKDFLKKNKNKKIKQTNVKITKLAPGEMSEYINNMKNK